MKFFVLRNKETGKYLKNTNGGVPNWTDGFDPAWKKETFAKVQEAKTTILNTFNQRKAALEAFINTELQIDAPIFEIVKFETHEVGVVLVDGEIE